MYRYTAEGLQALEGSSAELASRAQAQRDAGIEDRPRLHYLYDLKGVVVHSGTAFAGHYYSFIKERPSVNGGQVRPGRGDIGPD
jgi:ubiquitin C-terminal hydrolase